MPTVRLLSRRAVRTPCIARGTAQTRSIAHWKQGKWVDPRKKPTRTSGAKGARNENQSAPIQDRQKPSLVEQLFPEESKLYEAQQRQSREVPRLPLDDLTPTPPKRKATEQTQTQIWSREQVLAQMEAAGPGVSILVLRNASPNLTEEDFRRLIPQGRHIEGWTLDQGDILKVIPGRSLANLEQNNVYYLLFSSALGAFTYQGHVTRIHRLADSQTPTPAMSSIPPAPGYLVEGLDAHAAIQAYSLVPPSERLELRQLRPPLTPLMEAIIKYQGYPQLANRKGKSPCEARLSMSGPQLSYSSLMHIFRETGKARGLSWSGGDKMNLDLTRWEPKPDVSAHGDNVYVQNKMKELGEVQVEQDRESTAAQKEQELQRGRSPPEVYIVGFRTEKAAMSFVQYWHQRPLDVDNGRVGDVTEGDIPPIANVQLLW